MQDIPCLLAGEACNNNKKYSNSKTWAAWELLCVVRSHKVTGSEQDKLQRLRARLSQRVNRQMVSQTKDFGTGATCAI